MCIGVHNMQDVIILIYDILLHKKKIFSYYEYF
jgi:hypothetical protein